MRTTMLEVCCIPDRTVGIGLMRHHDYVFCFSIRFEDEKAARRRQSD